MAMQCRFILAALATVGGLAGCVSTSSYRESEVVYRDGSYYSPANEGQGDYYYAPTPDYDDSYYGYGYGYPDYRYFLGPIGLWGYDSSCSARFRHCGPSWYGSYGPGYSTHWGFVFYLVRPGPWAYYADPWADRDYYDRYDRRDRYYDRRDRRHDDRGRRVTPPGYGRPPLTGTPAPAPSAGYPRPPGPRQPRPEPGEGPPMEQPRIPDQPPGMGGLPDRNTPVVTRPWQPDRRIAPPQPDRSIQPIEPRREVRRDDLPPARPVERRIQPIERREETRDEAPPRAFAPMPSRPPPAPAPERSREPTRTRNRAEPEREAPEPALDQGG